jgi:hypothetical protein
MSRRLPGIAAALTIGAYFLWFAWDGLGAGFAGDDMMNLHGYWKLGPWHAIYSQFLLGTNAYRPLGALFYLPLYTLFGLNPLPFRVVILLVLAANTWLVWRLARELGAGEVAAALAALAVSYHAGLLDLHYNIAVVYDVLCFSFYWCALLYYMRLRRSGRAWRVREWAVFTALCVCALNAKEMAVTLPLALAAWEWLCAERREWRPAALVGALTALSVVGKMFGADPLMAQQAYHPVFTLSRYLESSATQMNELLYAGRFFSPERALLLWAAIAWIAWRRPRPVLRFCWAFVLFSPLPIVFLEGRIHSCLYLPLAGWAIFAGVLFEDVARALAGWLEREPLVGRLGRRALFAALTAVAVILMARVVARGKRRAEADLQRHGAQTAAVLAEFRRVNPRAASGSRILLIDDPFQDWDAKFIAELWFADRTVEVWLQNKTRLDEATVAREVHSVYRFEGARLLQMR